MVYIFNLDSSLILKSWNILRLKLFNNVFILFHFPYLLLWNFWFHLSYLLTPSLIISISLASCNNFFKNQLAYSWILSSVGIISGYPLKVSFIYSKPNFHCVIVLVGSFSIKVFFLIAFYPFIMHTFFSFFLINHFSNDFVASPNNFIISHSWCINSVYYVH